MSRSFISRGVNAAIFAAVGGVISLSVARAADSVIVVPGTLTQGVIKSSLTAATYAQQGNNLGDWPLNTGGSASRTSAISFEDPDFNGSAFGGTPNTIIAFGNGGGVTLKFATPITPVAGEKDLGIFTAQAISSGGALFNGNMEAAILVSEDGQSWYNLSGALIASPTTYTTTAYSLNAPTMAYDFGTDATAWTYGQGTSTANLNAIAVADFTTPMPDDDLFNGSGTSADRAALVSDMSTSDYTSVFGVSGGGNWFDISGSGLAEVNYVRLNGDANDPSTGGVRLDAVFANANAVPEPTAVALAALSMPLLLRRRRRMA